MKAKGEAAEDDDELESGSLGALEEPAAEWLTSSQVAALAMLHRDTFVRMTRRGEGPAYYTFGGLLRFRPEDVTKWIESQRVEPGQPAPPQKSKVRGSRKGDAHGEAA